MFVSLPFIRFRMPKNECVLFNCMTYHDRINHRQQPHSNNIANAANEIDMMPHNFTEI